MLSGILTRLNGSAKQYLWYFRLCNRSALMHHGRPYKHAYVAQYRSVLHSDNGPHSAQPRFNGTSIQRTTLTASQQHWQTITCWRGALPFICEQCSTTTIFLAVFGAEMKVWKHWYFLPPELRLLLHRRGQGSRNCGRTVVIRHATPASFLGDIHNSQRARKEKKIKIEIIRLQLHILCAFTWRHF
jgi:hypothetical protein